MSKSHDQSATQTDDSASGLRARWLGSPSLTSDSSTEAQLLALGKPLALLAYLDCAFRKSASRESVISLLWSEDADSRGRQNLRQTLFYIKQRLNRDVIETDGDRLTLTADFGADRTAFELAIEEQKWSEAVAAYGGPFLAGFAAPGSSGMEQWISIERTRLQRLFLGAADATAKELLSVGRAREAVAVARRARDEMRGEQVGWRILLEAQISAQDYLSALADANALEEQIANDGDELEPATKALIKAAKGRNGAAANGHGNGDHSQPSDNASATLARDLIAREHEFSTIIESWENVRNAKGGQWIHLEAPSGLGKSRLLSDIAARLRALRGGVVEVRASPGERDISCAFAANVAAALASRRGARGISEESASVIVALAPSASTFLRTSTSDTAVGNDALRRRALALSELLQCVAQENSIALLLDDLHWVDSESRVVLDAIFPKAREAGLLLVTAGRSLGAHDFASPPDVSMRLRGFDASEIVQLLTDVAALPDAAWATSIAERLLLITAGSPLLVLESVQRAIDAGLLRVIDNKWVCGDPVALERLLEQGSAIRYRVKQLDADASFLLVSLALAGVPLTEDVLGHLCSRRLLTDKAIPESSVAAAPIADAKPLLDVLEHRGMCRRRGANWDVAHDEIGEAAIAVVDAATLQRAHESIAGALLATGDRSPETLVRSLRHLVSASETVPQWLVRRVLVTARQRGDERAITEVIRESLRGVGHSSDVARVTKSAPLMLRLRKSAQWAIGALVLVTAIALGAVFNRMFGSTTSRSVDGARVLLSVEGDTSQIYAIDLSQDLMDGDSPMLARVASVQDLEIKPSELAQLSGGVNAIGQRLMQRPYASNLEIVIARGKTLTRIASDTADDIWPVWSPDGKSVLFTSRRWDQVDDHSEIAYWNSVTQTVSQLTDSRHSKTLGTLSPDGLSFVYSEMRAEPANARVCWQNTPDAASGSGCVEPDFGRLDPDVPVVWIEPTSVLVQLFWIRRDSTQSRGLARMDLASGATEMLVQDANAYFISANGQWILSRHVDESQRSVTRVRSILHPQNYREIVLEGASKPAPISFAHFERSATITEAAPTLRFATDTLHVASDVTASLGLEIRSRSYPTLINSLVAQLTTSDTNVFVVDSLRRVSRRGAGTAWLVAKLGKEIDSVAVIVDARSTSRVVFAEDWRGDWKKRWHLFGEPSSRVVPIANGSFALEPNGDGDYSSGIGSLQAFRASSGGFGAEIEIESRLTASKWQTIALALIGGESETDRNAWAEGMDSPPPTTSSATKQWCSAGYPSAEGTTGLDRMSYGVGTASQVTLVPELLRSGEAYRLRIQIFGDGSCRVAVNGHPLPASRGMMRMNDSLRLQISGASVGTTVRVLRATAWEGVRGDVDWK